MVNIRDFELDREEISRRYGFLAHMPDSNLAMLSIIFERQKELMAKYHDIEQANGAIVVDPALHGNLDNRYIQMRIKDMKQRCIEELMEAANTLKNKPWKQDTVLTDTDHFYEEIADAFHFFVELCITAGLDAGDLFKMYFLKSEVNKFRQRSGY